MTGRRISSNWRLSNRADFFFALREGLGEIYGSEDLSVLLYSLVKREAPNIVVELGTGLGVSTSWMAGAMKENGKGKIFTYDNGSHFSSERIQAMLLELPPPLDVVARALPDLSYVDFLINIFALADVTDFVECRNVQMSKEVVLDDISDQKIDLLFSDFDHSPVTVERVISAFLPYMSPISSIFIDSASTHLPSYNMLENLVSLFQQHKIPKSMADLMSKEEHAEAIGLLYRSRVSLRHLVEAQDRKQNSTAWIRIEPVDLRPAGSSFFH